MNSAENKNINTFRVAIESRKLKAEDCKISRIEHDTKLGKLLNLLPTTCNMVRVIVHLSWMGSAESTRLM